MTASTSSKLNRPLRAVAAAAFWLAAWSIAAYIVGRPLLLPSPVEVFGRLLELAAGAAFWRTAAVTLLRVAEGLLCGIVCGVSLAVVTFLSPVCDMLLSPAVRTVRAAPVASFSILLIVWFQSGKVPVMIAALMVIPIIWEGTLAGIRSADPQLLEMADVFGFGAFKKALRIYLPAAASSFLAAYKVSLGLAWKSGVTAEVIASPAVAIGRELSNGKVYLETADVFAWTIVVVALSLLLESLSVRLIKRWEAARHV